MNDKKPSKEDVVKLIIQQCRGNGQALMSVNMANVNAGLFHNLINFCNNTAKMLEDTFGIKPPAPPVVAKPAEPEAKPEVPEAKPAA